MRILRPSIFIYGACLVTTLLANGCTRKLIELRFRNFSADTIRCTVEYSHVRWYPESGYDLSQRNAGAAPPVLISGLGEFRNIDEHRIADSIFAMPGGETDSFLLPPAHTLWLPIAPAGAGSPSSITVDHRGHRVIWTQDSIRSLPAGTKSRDFY